MKTKKIYLVAMHYARPKVKRMSAVPGYMKNEANIAWDEQVAITTKLKPKDTSTASIILNISDRTVEKNQFANNMSFDGLFNYFYSSSKNEITDALRKLGIIIEQEPIQNEVNVSAEAEASARPELATTPDTVGTSQGT